MHIVTNLEVKVMLKYSHSNGRYDIYIENGKRVTVLKCSAEGRELYKKSGRAAKNKAYWKAVTPALRAYSSY